MSSTYYPRIRIPLGHQRRRSSTTGFIVAAAVVVAMIVVLLISWYGKVTTREWPMVLVTGRDSVTVNSGSGDSLSLKNEYRVYLMTPDRESHTVKVTDAIINAGRTRSADLYGALRPGRCFHLETYGVRVGITSSFPNVRTATEIPCTPDLAAEADR